MRTTGNSSGSGKKRSSSSEKNGFSKPKIKGTKFRKKASSKSKTIPRRAGKNQLFPSEAISGVPSEGVRLQKVLAAAGFGSRRVCEELITGGRVEVDRKTVTELGTKVIPFQQEIRVDGESLKKVKPVYLALYKPKGYLCTNNDPSGRSRTVDLIPEKFGRVFPIGRLDYSSEGLLLMTNDGALAERLTHPRFEVAKKYKVQVAGLVESGIVAKLEKGVYLAEGFARASGVKIKGAYKNSSILEIELCEGKNREIRRLLARMGHKVITLQRISVGPIKLGKMLPGEHRPLTSAEVESLYHAAEKKTAAPKKRTI